MIGQYAASRQAVDGNCHFTLAEDLNLHNGNEKPTMVKGVGNKNRKGGKGIHKKVKWLDLKPKWDKLGK